MNQDGNEDIGELEQALGRAISSWAAVEGALCGLFCTFSGANDRNAAAAIFTSILSYETQLAATRAAAKVTLANLPKVFGVWVELAKRLDRLRPLRNKLAHGNILIAWGAKDVALSADFVPFHHFGTGKVSDDYEHWSVRDLNTLNDAFVTLSADLSRLNVHLLGREGLPEVSPAPVLKLGRPSAYQRFHAQKQRRP